VRKVAVFGNGGAGKSTLARKLAGLTNLPLYPLDLIQYRTGGAKVAHDEYLKAHAEILGRDAWIIDGYGCLATTWQRLESADTLVYLDLPVRTHAWWVTKRFFKGLFRTPEGWPVGSPMIRSTLDSYRVVWQCHKHLTPKYRELVAESRHRKRVHHLTSPAMIERFLAAVGHETSRSPG